MKAFPKCTEESAFVEVCDAMCEASCSGNPLVLVRMRLPGQARNVDRVLQLIYDLKERKRWDKQLSDHFQVG